MLRREIPTGTQERGENTHKRSHTRAGESGPGLRARGKQKAPAHQGSRATPGAAQRSSAITDQDALRPHVSTPPRQTKEGEGEGGGGVEERLARSHRGRCIPSPLECQA